ncbi:hypothetical protein LMH87_010977 [Akanthomyces muscarius]|uniref:Uncharacterized protein n=1 Tax=Akanthomyces muscarius TaxID=2231603 RepID=A0A9W8QAU2_AKAMU|nr:hypothetical protein LMH87_010977 [Akanthomyces muscarius]KAJ4150218.1 hypothetical protein LMH87_010977 [Akanthomyces muscarius]
MLQAAKEQENARIERRRIREGFAASKMSAVAGLAQHDVCVMCNAKHATLCVQFAQNNQIVPVPWNRQPTGGNYAHRTQSRSLSKPRLRFLSDGSTPNKSVLHSVSTSGIPPYPWCGPIVALRTMPCGSYEDITLADFRHVIDYLMRFGTTETRESSSQPDYCPPGDIRGVKICCYGEKRLHGSERFVSVDVPRAHPIRLNDDQGSVSPISKLLGMPLTLWKYPELRHWLDPPGWTGDMCAESNDYAAILMRETDAESPFWGFALLYWNTDLGNVLVTCEDDSDLDIPDVEAMCRFAKYKVQPLFDNALGSGTIQQTKQEVLDFINKTNFMSFKDESLMKKPKEGRNDE